MGRPEEPARAPSVSDWLAAPVLSGRFVRLEALRVEHADALFEAGDAETFRYHLNAPEEWTRRGFRAFVGRVVGLPGRVTLVMLDAVTGVPIGSSAFMEIRPEHRGVEIGATWIAPLRRGTAINPEAKLLMLAHAFEALGAIRVQLKCDARNIHSQNAIAKLGGVREGVLRRHMIAPDGYVRDTVYFSILDGEWPVVRERLEQRLRGFGG